MISYFEFSGGKFVWLVRAWSIILTLYIFRYLFSLWLTFPVLSCWRQLSAYPTLLLVAACLGVSMPVFFLFFLPPQLVKHSSRVRGIAMLATLAFSLMAIFWKPVHLRLHEASACRECDFKLGEISLGPGTSITDERLVSQFGPGCVLQRESLKPGDYSAFIERKYLFSEGPWVGTFSSVGNCLIIELKQNSGESRCLARRPLASMSLAPRTRKRIGLGDQASTVLSTYGIPTFCTVKHGETKRFSYMNLARRIDFDFESERVVTLKLQDLSPTAE